MADMSDWKNDEVSIQRGDYGTNVPATTFFVLGRLASGPLQYLIAKGAILQRFGVPPPPSGGFITVLGLTVPRLPFLTALMPTVLSAKQAIWITSMCAERITMKFALFGVIADILYEVTTSLVFSAASVNPFWSERLYYIGMTTFYAGMAIEFFAEVQRLNFKSKPENKGKLCTTGFWGITRHINYTANVLFGFGIGLATGGLPYIFPVAGMYLCNFVFNAMPSIETYCQKKYGEQWSRYTEEVPYKLIPGIY